MGSEVTSYAVSALVMIERHNVEFLGNRTIFDADMSSDGTWIAVVGTDTADSAIYLGTEVRLHRQCRFPIVRIIDRHRFLVVETRTTTPDDKNAMLVSIDAPWKPLTFHAGDGIQDVLVTTNYIVCTYFDEGIFGNTSVSSEGIAVFNFDGGFCFGYRSRLKSAAVEISDCYAACNINGDEIAFCSYIGFPLVNWNLETGSHAVARLPGGLHYPSAITAIRGEYFFHSPYKSPNDMFHYKNGNYRQVATEVGGLKTLRDGKFLRVEIDGFSIIHCRNVM